MDAPDLGMARKRQRGQSQLEFILRQRVGAIGLEARNRIVAGIETDRIDLGKKGGSRLGAVVDCVVGQPQRRVVAPAVISLDP